jgi:hypothetical protein
LNCAKEQKFLKTTEREIEPANETINNYINKLLCDRTGDDRYNQRTKEKFHKE